jgi:hypothetical protein
MKVCHTHSNPLALVNRQPIQQPSHKALAGENLAKTNVGVS